MDDSRITGEQGDALAVHVACCPQCEKAFYRSVGMNEDGSFTAEMEACLAQLPAPRMTVEEGWQDLLVRCTDLAEAYYREEHRRGIRQVFGGIGRVAAVAACLAVVLAGAWVLVGPSKCVSPIAPRGYAQRVTETGRQGLTLGQRVRTETQRQEIWLGGMHRVVMNQNSSATFGISDQGTYEVELSKGELYVEVLPGHPFTVRTGNALLSVTGTKFDVKTDSQKTELALLKGSVRLSSLSQGQAVDVTAGCRSGVLGEAGPTVPVAIDATAITAWARDVSLANAVARAAPQQMDDGLLSPLRDAWRQPIPPDLDKLGYVAWRDTHQNWFAEQFPWVFKAEATLQKVRGVQADYIDLLMVSADIWQFHCEPTLPADQPLAKLEPSAVRRLARHYHVDEQELLRSVGLPEGTPEPTVLTQNLTPSREYLDSLRRWQGGLTVMGRRGSERDGDAAVFALRAGLYLANTRTAAYLWAKAHPQEARQLLSEPTYLASIPVVGTGPVVSQEHLWVEELRRLAVLAQGSSQAAQELLMTPPTSECVSQATEQQLRLAAIVAELVPQTDRTQEDKQR
ncbi:MAG: FecR domain-containing protein [Planctomycetota bacterium]|nr:FecR domain-containing protein [Planctomycetota bacterium]